MSWPSPHLISGTPTVLVTRLERPLDLAPLARHLQETQTHVAWLDSARPHAVTGRCSLLAWDPWLTLETSGSRLRLRTADGVRMLSGDPWAGLREICRRYASSGHPDLPPGQPGLIGILGYELNQWVERLPSPKPVEPSVPALAWYGMGGTILVDHQAGITYVVSVVDPHAASSRQARRAAEARMEWVRHASTHEGLTDVGATNAECVRLEPRLSQAAFETMVRRAQDYIAWGDIFQANLAQQFLAPWQGSPWTLYQRLRAINPSPFACFLRSPDWSLVSCSPERLVRLEGGVVSTRPIAGTRPRGAGPAEDAMNSLELILSDKERAEHTMLVDLARNDLGRVCAYGSVRVDELMVLEEYSHVTHIVSNVVGRMRPRADAVEVIRALFPGGTITGCPKVRAMEVIHELEPVGRGWYTGSCGWIGFDGALDLNILIRTITLAQEQVSVHAGAGIVADSDPAREYQETLAKAAALIEALGAASEATDAVAVV